MTARPTPWAMPPSSWPTSWTGLSTRPTSWEVVISTTRTSPRSSRRRRRRDGRKGERHEGVALPVGVELRGGGVVELDRFLEDLAPRPRRERGRPHRRPRRLCRRRCRGVSGATPWRCARFGVVVRARQGRRLAPRRRTSRSVGWPKSSLPNRYRWFRREPSRTSFDPEHLAGDLLREGDKTLADFDRGTGDGGDAVFEAAPRRRVVVEATAVHEVLDAHREPDASSDAVTVGGAPRAARQLELGGGSRAAGRQRRSGAQSG